MTPTPDRPTPEDLRARVQEAVAACVEALEAGEADPAPRVCGDDSALLARVQKRLAQLAAHGLIAPVQAAPPTQIGRYRIVRELGSGGMGQVYLAEQTEPVRRQVALKVVKLGMDTRDVLARFQAERQTLARLNHPSIAQVFDAGATPEGRPYFAMEHVPGEPLTEYCDRRRLGVAARVGLLAAIGRAVQHAHDRGFIHRDLKPSNLLVVDHEGEPLAKVIDFGVAKAMAGEPDDAARTDSLRTRAGQVLGTPEYMSPEQMALDGGDIDTRTDVYALGATLYELLCGSLPFDSQRLRRAGLREVEAILRDELPPPPSRRFAADDGATAAAARGATSAALARELAGELDWITARAMAKAREERYPSALALAEDLERWLRHDPVLAAPPGAVYRLRKFVRRHRLAVAAGAAVFVSLAAGLAVSLRATAREAAALVDMRTYFGLARDAVGNLVAVADEQLLDVPQAEPARRRMLADAMGFYEALRARQPGDDGLQRERLVAVQRIAQLQRQLGQPDAALATADACAAELRELRRRAPDDVGVVALALETASLRAAALEALGRSREAADALQAALDELGAQDLAGADGARARLLANLAAHRRDQPGDAIALYEEALRAIERDGDAQTHAAIAIELAESLTRVDRLDDAERTLATAAAATQRVAASDAAVARAAEARIADRRAVVLRRLGRIGDALTVQQQAIARHEALAQEHPDVPSHADSAAAGWHGIAQDELSRSRYDEALAAAERAVATRSALARRFPTLHGYELRLARALLAKADVEIRIWRNRRGDADAPPITLRAAATIADRLRAARPDDLEATVTYCAAHTALGSLAAVRGDLPQALAEHGTARDGAAAALARHGDSAEIRQQLAVAENNLFQAHLLGKDVGEARACAERGLEHLEAGLRLDARHIGLRDLFAPLTGRVAIARMRDGDVDGGIALLSATCRRVDRGDDAREQAALLLSQLLTGDDEERADRDELLATARTTLAERIAARGDVAAAQARPPQLDGISHAQSRLRDLDLRLALGHVCEALGDEAGQSQALAEAMAIEASMPGLAADRLRNLFAQAGEQALRRDDGDAAAAAARTLLARAGSQGGVHFIAAGLLAGAAATNRDEARRQALRDEAVAGLQHALEAGEVPAAAANQPRFAPLRGHPGFDAILRR